MAERLCFLQVLFLGVCGFGDFQVVPVGFGVVAVANIGHRLLHAIGQAVGFVVSVADGLFVFRAGLVLIAHESVGVAESELRGHESGIDSESRAIVSERALEVPGHAQQFSVRILRIGFLWQHRDVAVHRRECLRKLAVAGLDISQIVQCGGKILIDGEGLLKEALRLIVAVLSHQPIACEVEQVLVVGIHLEHVVHSGDAAEEITVLHFGNPGNHQLLTGRRLGRERFGFGASIAHFLGIAAVKGDPSPGKGEAGIFLDRGAPVFIATLEVKILVVGNAFFKKLPGLRG